MTYSEASSAEPSLADLSAFVAQRLGLSFPAERWPDLERCVRAASRKLGLSDPQTYIKRLLSGPLSNRELDVLVCHLTVGETYFFRDLNLFRALEEHVLPPLIAARRAQGRRLHFWSAGCASGEEAYSLAILLKKAIPDLADWRILIMATDINPDFLKKAGRGVYSEWSFRDTPPWVRERYFTGTSNGRWEILPEIREMVVFSRHNLAQDPHPPAIGAGAPDIIICRNVLMYFTPEQSNRVIHQFHRCLKDDGRLIVSPWEWPALCPEFEAVRLPDAVIYRKALPRPAMLSAPRAIAAGEVRRTTLQKRPEKLFPEEAGSSRRRGETKSIPAAGTALLGKAGNPALLAHHYANLGMIPEAYKYCREAIADDRFNPSLHYLLASVLQEEGRPGEAVQALKKVLYLDPEHALAYFSLGNLAAYQGKCKDAERCFANALRVLSKCRKEDVLPGSEGMTAGELAEIITSFARKEMNGQS